MSSAADASSLFGAGDSGHDPFGATVNSITDAPDDLFGGEAASDTMDLFASTQEDPYGQQGWLGHNTNGQADTNGHHDQSAPAPTHGQTSLYQQPAQQAYTPSQTKAYSPAAPIQRSTSAGYAAYAPPGQPPAVQSPYAPPVKSASSQSAYTPNARPSPYTPAASQYFTSPAPASSATTPLVTSLYGPNHYAPAPAPVSAPKMAASNSYGAPAYSSYQNSGFGAGVPEPPKPAPAAPYRPSKANAYDPPVSSAPKRKPASRMGSQVPPPVTGLPNPASPYGLPPSGTPGTPTFPSYGLPPSGTPTTPNYATHGLPQQPPPPPPMSRPGSAALPPGPPPPGPPGMAPVRSASVYSSPPVSSSLYSSPPAPSYAPPRQGTASPYNPPPPPPGATSPYAPPSRTPASPYAPPQQLSPVLSLSTAGSVPARSTPPPRPQAPPQAQPPPPPRPMSGLSRRGTPLSSVAYGLGSEDDGETDEKAPFVKEPASPAQAMHSDGVEKEDTEQKINDGAASPSVADGTTSPPIKLDPFWDDDEANKEAAGDQTVILAPSAVEELVDSASTSVPSIEDGERDEGYDIDAPETDHEDNTPMARTSSFNSEASDEGLAALPSPPTKGMPSNPYNPVTTSAPPPPGSNGYDLYKSASIANGSYESSSTGAPPRRASTISSGGGTSSRTSLDNGIVHGQASPYSPYSPGGPAANGISRATSPSAMSSSSVTSGYQPLGMTSPPITSPYAPPPPVTSPYAPPPPATSAYAPPLRMSLDGRPVPQPMSSFAPPQRSFSEGILAPPPPTNSTNRVNPYAPSTHKRDTSVTSQYGTTSYGTSPYALPPIPPTPAQEITLNAPSNPAYAPSPTLLGTNDPLGRVSARAPIFSMGFGGKIVTCFHGSGSTAGFDVALSSRQSTEVQIRVLHEIIPASALDIGEGLFPGPLFSDPGTPTAASLVRSGAAQAKAKKLKVAKYLDDRADELSQGLGYLHDGSDKLQQMEAKLVLVQLLKVLVEQDGRLFTPTSEATVRKILVPRLAEAIDKPEELTTMAAPAFQGLGITNMASSDDPLATYTIRNSSLDKLSDLLIQGDRKKAYQYALDEKLWAHAMVIASSVDKEAWKEVVTEFVRTELGASGANKGSGASSNGREPLRVAYNVFAGQGASALQEMIPPDALLKTGFAVPPPGAAVAPKVPASNLAKWAETAAMLLANPMTADISAALVSLADHLTANDWSAAAHVCYLLTGQPGLVGGLRNPAARVVLVGGMNPQTHVDFYRDQDAIIFSEILEFALSLAPAVKGQEPFHGIPHLQSYKLLRAAALAELGHVKLASRYCEAIGASLARGSPYIHAKFAEQLRGLADRLVATPQLEKGNSWIGSKVAKPSLGGIGSWFESRLTSIIAGEGEQDSDSTKATDDAPKTAYGPFSHYSTIGSTGPSKSPSPQPSMMNQHMLSNVSALGAADVRGPVERASSAMDIRRRASPVARTASVGPGFGFGQGEPYTSPYTNNPYNYGSSPTTARNSAAEDFNGQPGTNDEAGGWWGANNQPTNSVAPTFMSVDQGGVDDSGFMSLADTPVIGAGTTVNQHSRVPSVAEEDEDEDLGFGNSKGKPKDSKSSADAKAPSQTAAQTATPPAEKKDEKQTSAPAGGSWIGRWFKRESSTAPAPVKASLGEQSSFYYDKELKKWVNKTGGGDAPKAAAAPPPPSRPQSVVQARSAPAGAPPPLRPASAMNASVPPPPLASTPSIGPPRPRSSMMGDSVPGTPPPDGALVPPPPPGRPKSQASKRNVRSRYVDVFQAGSDAPQ